MRILVCTPRVPYPLISGDRLRTFNIFKELSNNNDIYLFFLKKSNNDLHIVDEFLKGKVFKDFSHVESSNSFFSMTVWSFFNREFLRLKHTVQEKISNIIKEKEIDVMHVHLLYMGFLLADFSSIPKVLDLTDSMSLYYLRELRLSGNPIHFLLNCFYFFRATRNEKYLLDKFDVNTLVSPIDKEYLRKLNKEADIRVIGNGVDTDYFSPKYEEDNYPSILFSGNMGFSPNVDATLYIMKEILPLVRSEIPRTKFYIVGAHPPKEIKKLGRSEGVIVTGFVEDIREHISRASVVLAPMLKGCGVKNKILESMALGKPVVTNYMGAEALGQDARDCLTVGNNSTEIADRVVELLKNKALREELGRRAAEVTKKRYTWKTCSKEYEKVYQELS